MDNKIGSLENPKSCRIRKPLKVKFISIFWDGEKMWLLQNEEDEGSSKYVRLCSSQTEVPSSSSMDLDLNRNQVLKGQFEVERPPNKRVGGFLAASVGSNSTSQTGPSSGHYRCDSCGSKFQLDYQLWWHWRDHIPIRDRLLCHLCPFVSANAESLQQVSERSES